MLSMIGLNEVGDLSHSWRVSSRARTELGEKRQRRLESVSRRQQVLQSGRSGWVRTQRKRFRVWASNMGMETGVFVVAVTPLKISGRVQRLPPHALMWSRASFSCFVLGPSPCGSESGDDGDSRLTPVNTWANTDAFSSGVALAGQ